MSLLPSEIITGRELSSISMGNTERNRQGAEGWIRRCFPECASQSTQDVGRPSGPCSPPSTVAVSKHVAIFLSGGAPSLACVVRLSCGVMGALADETPCASEDPHKWLRSAARHEVHEVSCVVSGGTLPPRPGAHAAEGRAEPRRRHVAHRLRARLLAENAIAGGDRGVAS